MRNNNNHESQEREKAYRLLLSNTTEEDRNRLIKDIESKQRMSHSDLCNIPGSVLLGEHCPPHISDLFLERENAYRVFLHGYGDKGPEEFKWSRKKRAIFEVPELLGKTFTAFLCEGCMRDETILLDPDDRFIACSDVLPQDTSVIYIVLHHHQPPHATAAFIPNGRKVVLLGI